MTYMNISPATITVPDYKSFRAAADRYKEVARFVVTKPLTESQLRRLPVAVRERLVS